MTTGVLPLVQQPGGLRHQGQSASLGLCVYCLPFQLGQERGIMESEQPPLPSPRRWPRRVMNFHRELLTLGGHPGTRNEATRNKVWVEPAGVVGLTAFIFLCWKL